MKHLFLYNVQIVHSFICNNVVHKYFCKKTKLQRNRNVCNVITELQLYIDMIHLKSSKFFIFHPPVIVCAIIFSFLSTFYFLIDTILTTLVTTDTHLKQVNKQHVMTKPKFTNIRIPDFKTKPNLKFKFN